MYIHSLDVVPKLIRYAPPELKFFLQIKTEELFKKVKFGPSLLSEERCDYEYLVLEYSNVFVIKHVDLPTITIG